MTNQKTSNPVASPSRLDTVGVTIALRPSKTCPDCGVVKTAVHFNPLKRGGSIREAITPEMERYPGEALTPDGLACICDECYVVYKRDYPGNVARMYAELCQGIGMVGTASAVSPYDVWNSARRTAVLDAILYELIGRNNRRLSKGLPPIGKIGAAARLERPWLAKSIIHARAHEAKMIECTAVG